jgi:hypothetical protein
MPVLFRKFSPVMSATLGGFGGRPAVVNARMMESSVMYMSSVDSIVSNDKKEQYNELIIEHYLSI